MASTLLDNGRHNPAPAGKREMSDALTGVRGGDFDRLSVTYQAMLDRSVRITGEGGEYFAELKARHIVKLVSSDFSGKVLDFGCGVGLLSRFLAAYLPACRLHGYDLSSASLQMVPAALAARGKFTVFEEELDSDYDLIVVANVMHHVPPESRQDVVATLKMRLAPGGRLVAFEHNPLNPLTRWAVKHCPFDIGVFLLWPGELLRYIEHAELQVYKRDYITFFPRWLSWFRRFEADLSWCPLGAQYVVVAGKR